MAGRCTECGRYHHDGPPCENCGAMSFRSVAEVKACGDCGTLHRDQNPPCKECGAMGFRKVNPDDVDESRGDGNDEVPSPSRYSRRKLLYGLGIVGALGAGGYVYFTGDGYPTTSAPGYADEAGGIAFGRVETAIRRRVNDERERRGQSSLASAGNVDALAEYYNKLYVKQDAGSLGRVEVGDVQSEFDVSAYRSLLNHWSQQLSGTTIESFESASDLAGRTVQSWMGDDRFREPLLSAAYSEIGLDVHATEDGDVFVLAIID